MRFARQASRYVYGTQTRVEHLEHVLSDRNMLPCNEYAHADKRETFKIKFKK